MNPADLPAGTVYVPVLAGSTKPLPRRERVSAPRHQATPEKLAAARRLLEDGASYNEAGATVGLSSTALARHLPGFGWTFAQAGVHTAALRAARRDAAAAGIVL